MKNLNKKSISLIETIRIQNGIPLLLDLHQERMNRAFTDLFCMKPLYQLSKEIVIPYEYRSNRVKCRIVYSSNHLTVGFESYSPKEITSLKKVQSGIDYSYKYEDRSFLQRLLEEKKEASDILIIKNGYVTDTSYSNVALLKNKVWYTPATPLLSGVKRRHLLHQGLIQEASISESDILSCDKIMLINAMLDFEEIVIETKSIF